MFCRGRFIIVTDSKLIKFSRLEHGYFGTSPCTFHIRSNVVSSFYCLTHTHTHTVWKMKCSDKVEIMAFTGHNIFPEQPNSRNKCWSLIVRVSLWLSIPSSKFFVQNLFAKHILSLRMHTKCWICAHKS